ncbi:unnamed protein product [Discosporangium mesarthrocarpum]
MSTADERREARRQKILARSQVGTVQVHDLARGSTPVISGGGILAVAEDPGDPEIPGGPPESDKNAGKSAARIQSELRRQRIQQKTAERMKKVTGDRKLANVNSAAAVSPGSGGLQAVEGEEYIAGRSQESISDTAVAEGKAQARPAAPLFKPGHGSGGGGGAAADEDIGLGQSGGRAGVGAGGQVEAHGKAVI